MKMLHVTIQTDQFEKEMKFYVKDPAEAHYRLPITFEQSLLLFALNKA